MKKRLLFSCIFATIALLFSSGLSAQNVLTNPCPAYSNPTGGGALEGDTDAFYLTATTETNGDITFTIYGVPGNTNTAFRNNGWADGIITGITVNGEPNTENVYFTRTINAEKTKITLVKNPAATIPADAAIHINGILEYRTATSVGEDNLWPVITIDYTYGTICNFVQAPLATPAITSIDASKVITFSAVPNAANYIAYVYRDGGEVYSQAVTSGGTLNFTPLVTANYEVKLVAVSNDINYLNSAPSAAYTWHLNAETVELGPSEYCNYRIGTNAANYINLTWQTDASGNVIITASGYAGDEAAAFRGNGLGGNLDNFKVNGNNADNYFTRVYAGAGSNTYTLELKSGTAIVPGDKITFTGTVEWTTGSDTNAYGTYSFNYTYGTDCSSLPTVNVSPASISFSPTLGSQQFTVTGSKLTSAVTITPPHGISVSPATISPDGTGNINQVVTAAWTSGTYNGAIIQISGGGLPSAVPVTITTSEFSDFCNKVIYQEGSSNWGAYLHISTNEARTAMTFTIAPLNADETAVWNRIENISVNGGENNALVASNVRSEDKSQITVTFTEALNNNDQVTFGGPIVWEVNRPSSSSNANVYINALQGPYIVGSTCSLDDATSSTVIKNQPSIIYPNPAKDVVNIKGDIQRAVIYSATGQKVLEELQSNTINVSSLKEGIYLIVTEDSANKTSSAKLQIKK